jgi:uncharacterized protein (UPF0332 family)
MTHEERDSLVTLRFEQAEEAHDAAVILIANEKYISAISRIYYGMFYAVTALSIKYGFETSKHARLLGWFNKEFIHTGLLDVKFSQIVRDAFDRRTKADYDTAPLPPVATVEQMVSDMRIFIDEIKKFIEKSE